MPADTTKPPPFDSLIHSTPERRPPGMEKKGDVIEGTFREEGGNPERGVARVDPPTPQDLAIWTPSFETKAVDRAIAQVKEKRRFFDEVMESGKHYAIIPGQRPTPHINQKTGEQEKDERGNLLTDAPKPALLKPGAELLLSSMGLHPEVVEDINDEDWSGEKHGGEPFFRYRRRCNVWRQTGPGPDDRMLVASASGECNSWEEKYRWRGSGRVCPECGFAGVMKGNPQYAPTIDGKRGSPRDPAYKNGGWLCWKKKGGCGMQFADADERLASQTGEKMKNPNPADLTNTLLKMADKRALVAATLLATGCSDLFTQDIEDRAEAAAAPAGRDDGGEYGGGEPPPPADAKPAAPTTKPINEIERQAIVKAFNDLNVIAKTNGHAGQKTAAEVVAAVNKYRADNAALTNPTDRKATWTGLWERGGSLAPNLMDMLGVAIPTPGASEDVPS